MSIDTAMALVRKRTADLLNVRANAMRSEIYGTLEEARVGAGKTYTTTFWTDGSGKVRPGEKLDNPITASAPGDPPARQTGRLQESIKVLEAATPSSLLEQVGPDPSLFTGDIAPYPFYLEYGTETMEARPYMRPSVHSFKEKIRSGS